MTKNAVVRVVVMLALLLTVLPETIVAQKYPFELATNQLYKSDVKSNGSRIEERNRHAALMLPIPIVGPAHLFINARETEKSFTYDFSSTSIALSETDTLYNAEDFPEKLSLSMKGLGLYLTFEQSTVLMVRKETVATDRVEINSSDNFFGNQFIYGRKIDNDSSWLIGFLHTYGMAADSYIPLVGYEYKSDSIHFNTVFPSFGFLQIRLGENWYLMFDESVESDSYRLTETAPWFNSYFSFLNLTSRVEIGYRTSIGLELGLSYGLTTHRFWKINDADKNELGDLNLKDSAVTSLQFQWRP